MGGPALHVAYLSAGLATAATTRRSSPAALARGEESMAFVAEELGVAVVTHPASCTARSRRSATCSRRLRLARLIRDDAAARSCTRTPRRRARSAALAALLAGDARPPIVVHTFHGHVLRGYFGPLRDAALPPARALARAADDGARRRQPARCATTSSRSASRRRRSSRVVRLGIELDERVGARRRDAGRDAGACSASRRTASSSAGSAA